MLWGGDRTGDCLRPRTGDAFTLDSVHTGPRHPDKTGHTGNEGGKGSVSSLNRQAECRRRRRKKKSPLGHVRWGFPGTHPPCVLVTLLSRLAWGPARSNVTSRSTYEPGGPMLSGHHSNAREIWTMATTTGSGLGLTVTPPVRCNLDLQDYRHYRSGGGIYPECISFFLPAPRMTERQVPDPCYPDLVHSSRTSARSIREA